MITSKELVEMFPPHKTPSPADLDRIVKKIQSVQRVEPMKQGYLDRLQRSSSWLSKAMQMDSDPEARFIFMWIALNALCGVRQEVLKTEWWESEKNLLPHLYRKQGVDMDSRELEWFLWRVCGLDLGQGMLKRLLRTYQSDIRIILQTEYLMPNYWSWEHGENEVEKWKESGRTAVERVIRSNANREATYRVLCEIIAWRLRTLRNQLFHGSATHTHSKRRAAGKGELEAGSRFLEELIWRFLVLMAGPSGQARDWPPCRYPRAGSAQHGRFKASWLSAK